MAEVSRDERSCETRSSGGRKRGQAAAACHEAYGVPHTAALIQRTKGGKPYLAARPDTALAGTPDPGPNWNFNVSHEGHYVVLAAEPLLLCGVDVAAPDQSRVRGKPRPLEEHFATMKVRVRG